MLFSTHPTCGTDKSYTIQNVAKCNFQIQCNACRVQYRTTLSWGGIINGFIILRGCQSENQQSIQKNNKATFSKATTYPCHSGLLPKFAKDYLTFKSRFWPHVSCRDGTSTRIQAPGNVGSTCIKNNKPGMLKPPKKLQGRK